MMGDIPPGQAGQPPPPPMQACPPVEDRQPSRDEGLWCLSLQAANLAGFRASEDRRFEAGIPDFMNGILNLSIHFNVVHKKLDWRNPKMKSLKELSAEFPLAGIE